MIERAHVNVYISKVVWKTVRLKAVEDETSAASIVEAALRHYLGMSAPPAPEPTRKPTRQPAAPSPDQIEAERLIQENDSMNARQLADLLNDAGHRTMRGAAWSQNTVNKTRLRLRRQGVV